MRKGQIIAAWVASIANRPKAIARPALRAHTKKPGTEYVRTG